MIYGLIAVCLTLFVVLGLHEKERESWAIERGKLLDRIQAHSLSEYKALSDDEKPEDKDKKEDEEPEYVR